MKLAAAALLVLMLGGEALAQPLSQPLQNTPRDQLMAADRAFSRLSATRGRSYAFLAMAANNARLFGADGVAPVYGRAQAFRVLSRRPNDRMRWEPLAAGVSSDGRMGWTDGRWDVTRAGVVSSGHYLTVWVKDRRGAWKVQANMNTGDPVRK